MKKNKNDKVIIRREVFYYEGTFYAPKRISYLVPGEYFGDYDEALVMTRAEAEALIAEWYSRVYWLSHGEYGRPAYTIIRRARDNT